MTSPVTSKVGSYAAVLKRRFPANMEDRKTSGIDLGQQQFPPLRGKTLQLQVVTENTVERGKGNDRHCTSGQATDSSRPNGAEDQSIIREIAETAPFSTNVNVASGSTSPLQTGTTQRNHDSTDTGKNNTHTTISLLEQRLVEKINAVEKTSKQLMDAFEQKVEKQIDTVLEDKLGVISNLVANKVTTRLQVMMTKFVSAQQNPTQAEQVRQIQNITQDSPHKVSGNTPKPSLQGSNPSEHIIHAATQPMLLALIEIENTTTPTKESSHDTLTTESNTADTT